MKPVEKLRAATGYLILHHPFIATPLLRLKLLPDPREATAAVDGRSIFYNEDFVTGLTPEETIFLLAHEVLHVALAHHLRRGDRNPKGWNAAADYVINLMLQDAGFAVIKGGLLTPDGRPSGSTNPSSATRRRRIPRPWAPRTALPARRGRSRASRTSSPKALAARSET